ncbi:hypothetical protein WL99_10495 [Burkholderia cepacia]|nr:hypothetical protein WL99_10495 [Burkholderia cepacia]
MSAYNMNIVPALIRRQSMFIDRLSIGVIQCDVALVSLYSLVYILIGSGLRCIGIVPKPPTK